MKDRYIHVNGIAKGYAMTGGGRLYSCSCSGCQTGESPSISLFNLYPSIRRRGRNMGYATRPQIMEEKIASLAGRRNLAMSELDKVKNISYIKPQGAFYIFIDLRDALEKSDKFSSTDSLAFAQFLLESEYVAMVPGRHFSAQVF